MFVKKSILLYTLFIFGLGFFAVVPNIGLAQDDACKNVRCIDASSCKGENFEIASDPCCSSGKVRCVVKQSSIELNVPIPGSTEPIYDITTYINTLMTWLFRLGGIVAAMVIVWGGYTYITAAGNQARIGQAKEIITGGIIGLALLFGAVTLLGYINPNLTNSNDFRVDAILTENSNFEMCNTYQANDTSTCGETTKDATGKSCISGYCGGTSGLKCLPTMVGGGGVTRSGFSCVSTTESGLEDACEAAPRNLCYVISNEMSGDDKCGPSISGCAVGEILWNCEGQQLNCNACGIVENGQTLTKYYEEDGLLKKAEGISGFFTNFKDYAVSCTNPSSSTDANVAVDYYKYIDWSPGSGVVKMERGVICCQEGGKNLLRFSNEN